jgi:GWxTD domain-containing protein
MKPRRGFIIVALSNSDSIILVEDSFLLNGNHMIFNKVIPVFCILFFYMNAYAQLDFIPFNVDYATFQGSENKTYTEIYVSFFQSELMYQTEDTLQVAHFVHNLTISKGDSIIQTAVRKYKNTERAGVNTKKLKQFMDVFAFEFDPGSYTLQVGTIDDVANKKGDYSLTIEIPEFGSDLAISDIQLATRIEKTENKTNFSIKNNLGIYPNPSRTYGLIQPLLYFYFEAYNLTLNEEGHNRYTYHYYISDADGERVRDFPEKIKSTSAAIIAESGGTNIITLATNDYILVVELEDMLSRDKLIGKKKFRVVRPSHKSTNNLAQSRPAGYEEYLNYTREELTDEFEKVTYIAIDQELEIFEGLDEEGMKRFLAEFWNRRDPDPTTEVNEYKREYFENLEYAHLTFSNTFREGWNTDRGRILLIYGRPDEIERYPSSMDISPYEIWQYYGLEGGSYFVFADITGHGSFDLLHSTYRNEIKDPNWRERIGASR